MRTRPLAVLALLALAGCGTAHPSSAVPGAQVAAVVPPDLSGHQYDTPDADQVLVAGWSTDLALPTGRVRMTVMGPAYREVRGLRPLRPGELHHYLATFTVTAKVLTGTAPLSPTGFRLLAIADQVDGGARVTSAATASTLVKGILRAGAAWTGTWTAPFVEGHGELLFTPVGRTRPAALWDFRVES